MGYIYVYLASSATLLFQTIFNTKFQHQTRILVVKIQNNIIYNFWQITNTNLWINYSSPSSLLLDVFLFFKQTHRCTNIIDTQKRANNKCHVEVILSYCGQFRKEISKFWTFKLHDFLHTIRKQNSEYKQMNFYFFLLD